MINLTQETLIAIREVPRLLPLRPNGKRLHISAVYRWVQRGVDGVRLEAVCVGGTTYTSLEALQRFSQDRATPRTMAEISNPTSRERELERVSRRVSEELGISVDERRTKAAE